MIRRMEAIHGPSFSPLEGKLATSYQIKHLFCLFFSVVLKALTDDYVAVDRDRIKNKNAATDRIHKLEEPMASFFF